MKKILTFILLFICSSIFPFSPRLDGKYHEINNSSSILILNPDKTFQWGDKTGFYAIRDNNIWFLNSDRKTGTKWSYGMARNELTLQNPEDFIYRGRGLYIYMRFTNPKTKYFFKRIR